MRLIALAATVACVALVVPGLAGADPILQLHKAKKQQAEWERDEWRANLPDALDRRLEQAERERDEAIAACVGDIELEQAIRERDEAQEEADQLDNRLDELQRTEAWLNAKLTQAEACLAKVPALVDALREIIAYGTSPDGVDVSFSAVTAHAALAVWEQE